MASVTASVDGNNPFDGQIGVTALSSNPNGLYVQGVWGFKRRWVAGLRYDRADGESSPFTDNAVDPLRDFRERWSTNVTFYPSEFSKFRLQYNWDDAEHLDRDASSLVLQFEFLYGAHGGHKF